MRHKNRGRKLGRNSSHRKALGRNILRSLFDKGQIITTLVKAKEYASFADRLITIAKRTSLKVAKMEKQLSEGKEMTTELKEQMQKQAQAIKVADIRRALAKLPDSEIIQKLFNDIAPIFATRNGGYTSVLRLNKSRLGDNSPLAVLRLTEVIPEKSQKEKTPEEKEKEKERLAKKKEENKRKKQARKERAKEKAKQIKEKEKARIKKEKEEKKSKNKK